MADLRININGSDNASPALERVGQGVEKLGKSFTKFAEDSMVKAGAALIDFAKDSVKASEDQARADRQLRAVAGDMTEAFKAQASALQESLGVEDDQIQKLQTMLLRYGEAPESIDKTIRAMLDYSAVTGNDVVASTQHLITSVEGGRTAFKELGLNYEKTGQKSKDLVAITDALQKKVGGGADLEADSLAGSVKRAVAQWHELQETVGGFFGLAESKLGLLGKITEAIKGMNTALGGDAQFNRMEERGKLLDEQILLNSRLEGVTEGVFNANQKSFGQTTTYNELLARQVEIKKRLAELDYEGNKASGVVLGDKGLGNQNTQKHDEQMKTEADKAEKHREAILRINDEMLADGELFRLKAIANLDEYERDLEKHNKAVLAIGKAERDEIAKATDQHLGAQIDVAFSDTEEEAAVKDWEEAGARIGQAFTSALSSAIDQLANGGDVDAGEQVGNILATVLAVAGSVIGTLIAPGVGAAIGGALGGLAGAGIKAATRRPKHRHDGGWAGDEPRYHSGAWVGTDEESAVLQSGERVLSRPEVQAMGGPSGVDAATRGGGRGGINVTVQTLDGSTAREYFERAGGRALLNAVRTGRGAPSLLFGDR